MFGGIFVKCYTFDEFFNGKVYKINNTSITPKFICSCTYTTPLINTVAFDKLDEVGNQLLNAGQIVGYWVVAVVATFQLIKAITDGDKHKVGEVLMTSILTYGSLFVLPYALSLVKEIF